MVKRQKEKGKRKEDGRKWGRWGENGGGPAQDGPVGEREYEKEKCWQRPRLPGPFPRPVPPGSLGGLTSGFGMSPGVSRPLWPPAEIF